MPKRGQGEGTISKRADGTWWGRLTVGRTPDGSQKRKAFYGKTRAEVQKKMVAAQSDINNGVYVEPSKLTVGQWLDTWLEEYKKLSIKSKTYCGYEQMIRLYIKPAIGKTLLSGLRPEHLQQLYNSMQEKNLSTSTIRQTHIVIHSSLKQGVINGLITRNVSEAVQAPKTKKRQARALSPDERKIVLEALSRNKFGTAFMLDLYTGMRKGELLALMWEDINFDEGYITVKRTLDRVRNFDDDDSKTKIVVDTPKTESGLRVIPLGENALNLLKSHKAKQLEMRQYVGGCWTESGYVFTTELGKHLEPRYFSKVFEDLKKETGIADMTIHTLRHTFATQGLEQGVDMKTMQNLLGHASYVTTANIYMHVNDSLKRSGVNLIEQGYEEL